MQSFWKRYFSLVSSLNIFPKVLGIIKVFFCYYFFMFYVFSICEQSLSVVHLSAKTL